MNVSSSRFLLNLVLILLSTMSNLRNSGFHHNNSPDILKLINVFLLINEWITDFLLINEWITDFLLINEWITDFLFMNERLPVDEWITSCSWINVCDIAWAEVCVEKFRFTIYGSETLLPLWSLNSTVSVCIWLGSHTRGLPPGVVHRDICTSSRGRVRWVHLQLLDETSVWLCAWFKEVAITNTKSFSDLSLKLRVCSRFHLIC